MSGTLEVLVKSLFFWRISNDMWGKVQRVLKVYTGGMKLGKKLLKFCDEKELLVANIWFYKAIKMKITYSSGRCKTEIDLCLWEKNTESI